MTVRSTDTVTVVVMAKAPDPGRVKTRLIPVLGPKAAAELHARLTREVLHTAVLAGVGSVELCCAPGSSDDFFVRCQAQFGVNLSDQTGGDLGQRMSNVFRRLLPRGPVIVIGADCPALEPADLRGAAEALRRGSDAVFSPAEDGGYVLIGLRRFDPAPFEDIPWGTDAVMEATRLRLKRQGIPWHELRTRWDVDRPRDLMRLVREGFLAIEDPMGAASPCGVSTVMKGIEP